MEQFNSLKTWQRRSLFALSLVLVSFGQPAWSNFLGMIAACMGFACFWRALLDISRSSHRFLVAVAWYGAVQWIQLSWFLSHPFLYIYGVLLFCSLLVGVQGGILALWITPKNICRMCGIFSIAGMWVLLEWSRLFILSGLPFNPVGMSLTGSLYGMQLASVVGVYGLSFLVMITNLMFLRTWLFYPTPLNWALTSCLVVFPYFFGWVHVGMHEKGFENDDEGIKVVLVQPALPIEEGMHFQSADEKMDFILGEWRRALETLGKQQDKTVDLIIFPEYFVPYGAHHHIFPLQKVESLFKSIFDSPRFPFPPSTSNYVELYRSDDDVQYWVSNGFLAQTVANLFKAHVVIGLDERVISEGMPHSFSSAFHFIPNHQEPAKRYDKRILVPMGEYIPFEWCRHLAARYGITGSFTCGTAATVFNGPVPFGASICYEEMYGNLMRECRVNGAELLVNLTNDGWYPDSRLPQQHFDHARLRTVENGIPLVRACNTGITGGVDSLGRVIGKLEEKNDQGEELADSIWLDMPRYHYSTLYSKYGDLPAILSSIIFILLGIWEGRRRKV